MPIRVEYYVEETNCPLGQKRLDEHGDEGWRLGGIAQTTVSASEFGLGSHVLLDVYFYTFWRENGRR
jgi:hypothetical protein